jgi:hypothetical protein
MAVWIFFLSAALTAQNSPRLEIHIGNVSNLWNLVNLPLASGAEGDVSTKDSEVTRNRISSSLSINKS